MAGGWSIRGARELAGCTLRRSRGRRDGFVLVCGEGGDETERASSSGLSSGDFAAPLRFLLLGDGRLFRMVLRDARDPRYDLLSWEVPGEYLSARAATDGWRIDFAPAGSALTDIDELLLLFGAEILDSESPLDRPEGARVDADLSAED